MKMTNINNITKYYKSCYQADNKSVNLYSFFSSKVEQRLILSDTDLISNKYGIYPVPRIWGEKIDQILTLDSKEKALYCCALFLSGQIKIIGKLKKAFTPLYLFPCRLILEKEMYFLEIEIENAIINPAFLDVLKTSNIHISYTDLADRLPSHYIGFDQIAQIESALNSFLPNLKILNLHQLINEATQKSLGELKKLHKKDKNLKFIPAIGVAITAKSTGSRGVINELEQMSGYKDYSRILQNIFVPSSTTIIPHHHRKILSPVSLSPAQMDIIHMSHSHTISAVLGPPGTGKSYTIAAITADLIRQGQSVLIASKNNQAGTVVAQKMENDFGLKGIAVQTSSRRFKTKLKKRLRNLANGYSVQPVSINLLNKKKKEIDQLTRMVDRIENSILDKEKDEIKWGQFFYKYKHGFFEKYKKRWIEYRSNKSTPIWELKIKLDKNVRQLRKVLKSYIVLSFEHNLYNTLRQDRKVIQRFIEALESDTGNQMESYFESISFSKILNALPIWIVNTSDIHSFLPFKKELFDVVIFDESSQCDVASSLPLLQRAKRLIVVGDTKQLRHVSFLAIHQQDEFALSNNISKDYRSTLNYRNNSLIDLVLLTIPSQDQIFFLDEHFRSMPEIIDFSNQHFYDNRLKIMTSTPISRGESSVFLHKIDEQSNKQGTNQKEAEAIINKVKSIIAAEFKLSPKICQSIGILSPFRSQVNYIKNSIRHQLTLAQLKRHSILIGTPHQFQGEERDVMLISFVINDHTHPSTYSYLNKADVFNVSITRARSHQHIYYSINPNKLPLDNLLSKYINSISISQPNETTSEKSQVYDLFASEVVEVVKNWGIEHIYIRYPIAGILIDLVIVHDGKTYCIDLIGFPGELEKILPLDRWKMLERIQSDLYSLTYSAWYLDKESCLTSLKTFLRMDHGYQK